MTWTVTKESGAVSFSSPFAEEQGDGHAERQALVQAFRAHPPISLKLTLRPGHDPFERELAAAEAAAPGLALFLGASRSLYEDLLNRLPMMILVIDADGTIVSANQATAEMLGHAAEDLIGRQALSLLSESSQRRLVEDVLPQFAESGRFANVDVDVVTASGEAAPFRMTAVGDRRAEGGIERSIAVFADMRPAPAKAKILVVDDDGPARAAAVAILVQSGYQVLEAGDAVEALQFVQDCDDIDVLLTDVVIPGDMNGLDLSQAASLIRPGLRILHVSGYPKGALVYQDEPRIGDDVISKPYRREDLRRAIAAALAGRTA